MRNLYILGFQGLPFFSNMNLTLVFTLAEHYESDFSIWPNNAFLLVGNCPPLRNFHHSNTRLSGLVYCLQCVQTLTQFTVDGRNYTVHSTQYSALSTQ